MRVVIVDDEPNAIKSLEVLLKAFVLDAQVVGVAKSVKEAVSIVGSVSPDLVFLDIKLTDGLGLDVLKYFPDSTFCTVFVTAYDHYAIDAIRSKAFDYLLKPIDPDDLVAVMHRFRKDEMAKPITIANKFTVPTQNGKLILDIGKVIRLQSDNNYTKVYLKERQVLVAKTLKKFEVLLTSHHFIRVHQSHMVNLLEVKEYSRSEGGFVRMSDGEEVPVSRANKGALEQALNRYIEGC